MAESSFPSELNVRAEQPIKLVPSKPTPAERIYLSNIDLAVVFHVGTVHFIRSAASDDDLVAKTRNTVSELLVPYHFMAGRLQFNPDCNRLELICNRSGVLFAAARSDLTLQELGDVSRPNPSFRNLVIGIDGYQELADTPLLTLQITRFKCGGFCIGMVTNHSLMDGQSAAEFLQNFASMARGEGLVIEPKYDRTCLRARVPPRIEYPHRELIDLERVPSTGSFTSSASEIHSVAGPLENQSYKVFWFSPQMVDRLKQKAMRGGLVDKCSTFEAMAAHLWQTRTKAVFDDPRRTSSVLFAVNIRSRISPALEKGFVGNGVLTASASASVHDLNENSLSFCVAKIREAIAAITDDYIRSAVDWLEVHRGIPATIDGNFFLSAWCKLPFYEMDFGWGKPMYSGPVLSGMPEFVLLLSHASQEGLNVWLVLESHHMKKFEMYVYDF